MKNTKLKSLLCYILVIGMVAGLLISMTACKKKKPAGNETKPTETTSATESTRGTEPTEETIIPETTVPVVTLPPVNTEPEESTGAVNCEHIPGAWIVDKPSTCTTEGSRHTDCVLCGQTAQTETIPIIPHIPGTWVVDKASTCGEEGTQYQQCTQCGARMMTITLAKIPHTTEVKHGYTATAASPGKTDGKVCKVCGKTVLKGEQIPAGKTVDFTYAIQWDPVGCSITGLGLYSNSVIAVPDTISGYPVTSIADNTFEEYAGITEISLPASVKSIGARAFSGCTNLKRIVFAGTAAQWNSINKSAIWNADVGAFTIQCTDGALFN